MGWAEGPEDGGSPSAGIRQMPVLYFLPSGSGCWTVAASQVPSGERRRPVTR
jgi:hypothetical protein